MTEEEKRRRIATSIPVKIKGADNIFSTETIDISPSGAYCRTGAPLPLLSKVAITLAIPAEFKEGVKLKTIECGGTIVRTHPVIVDGKTIGYDVAIFFNEIEEEDRTLLTQYINQHSNRENQK